MMLQNNKIYCLSVLLLASLSSGTATAACSVNLDMDGQKIINLATPTSANDGASKQYVDEYSSYIVVGVKVPGTINNIVKGYSSTNTGSGFNCLANHSSQCTINFDGAVMADFSILASSNDAGCNASLYLDGSQIKFIGGWTRTLDASAHGSGIFKVSTGDVITWKATGNAASCRDTSVVSGVQYVRFR